MITTEHFFLLYFFPSFILIYLTILRYRQHSANFFLAIASCVFYVSFGTETAPLLLTSLVLDYVISIGITKSHSKTIRRMLTVLVIVENLGILGYFKYVASPSLFPLGLSFITFQRISYIIDNYKTKKGARSFLEFMTYATLFPHIIAGPIVRFSELVNTLRKRVVTPIDIFQGMKLVTVGLFLKIIIADRLFVYEDYLFSHLSTGTSLEAVIASLFFSFRIYTDFSGYSFMAIGLARLMGFIYPENFNSPYMSSSFTEFWKRWNITLSRWLRDYVYIPLGGSRNGAGKTYINLFITMTVAGAWHGDGLVFLIWGVLHGSALVIERIAANHRIRISWPIAIKRTIVFVLVSILWITFKVQSIDQVAELIANLKQGTFSFSSAVSINYLLWASPSIILAAVWSFLIGEQKISSLKPSLSASIILSIIFAATILYSLRQQSVPFIYFQF